MICCCNVVKVTSSVIMHALKLLTKYFHAIKLVKIQRTRVKGRLTPCCSLVVRRWETYEAFNETTRGASY